MRFKYLILLLCFVLSFSDLFSQKIISDSIPENPISLNAFKNGEWFEFRVYYGVFNTSYISYKPVWESIFLIEKTFIIVFNFKK